jgi:hypothetical protein
MNAEELKHRLKEIFGEQVTFNREFDYYAETIKNIGINLLDWCKRIKEEEIKPIFPKKLKDGLVFIKKIGSSNRCIVVKVVNGKFKEIHLGDHEYYDKLTKVLGLKKSSKTY